MWLVSASGQLILSKQREFKSLKQKKSMIYVYTGEEMFIRTIDGVGTREVRLEIDVTDFVCILVE